MFDLDATGKAAGDPGRGASNQKRNWAEDRPESIETIRVAG